MANTFQIKRKAALAGAAPWSADRVNLSNSGGANNEYVAGDKVSYQGNYYVALANNDALVPTTGAPYWSLIGPVAEAPATMLGGELAYSEGGDVLFIGTASAPSAIGGVGRILTLDTTQTVVSAKTFSDVVVLSSAVATTQVASASGAEVATTEFVQNVFAVLDGGNFDDGGGYTPTGTGKYWYSTSATAWNTQTNWYTDAAHLYQAASLPDGATDVIILGNIGPSVDLDAAYWVQPNSIDSGTATVTFTSQNYGNVTCSISGNAVFNGNSTYNV
jgi:hypothetical protein